MNPTFASVRLAGIMLNLLLAWRAIMFKVKVHSMIASLLRFIATSCKPASMDAIYREYEQHSKQNKDNDSNVLYFSSLQPDKQEHTSTAEWEKANGSRAFWMVIVVEYIPLPWRPLEVRMSGLQS
jgi:hypothetical protein